MNSNKTLMTKTAPSATAVTSANRNYKDTVFRLLFSDKVRLLELYNAVSGKHYTNPDDLEIVTLENAVYLGFKNDLAFLLDTGIYLYEHQSTVNPNIPLRDLIYIAAEYNKLVETKSLYSSTVQKIPTPNFIVFYNGEKEIEDRDEYRLSDAYETAVNNPALELRVTVLNVNYGRNSELMEQCRTLKDYSQYVALVRRYKKELGSLDKAVKTAIDECINNGILSDFLRKNRAEVEMTSILEYNQEEEEKKLRMAEHRAGYDEGHSIGLSEGRNIGLNEGRNIGLNEGLNKGQRFQQYKMIQNYISKKNVSLEEACDTLGVSLEEYREAENLYKKQ